MRELRASGFNRLWQQGRIVEFSTPESLLDLDFTLPVSVLLDRIVVSAESRARIVDAVEVAYREAGQVIFEEAPREEGRSAEGCGFRRATNARNAIGREVSRNRGCSASTIRLALSALPGIWQHGGLRPGAGDSRPGAELLTERSIHGIGRSTGHGSASCASARRSWMCRWTCHGARCRERRAKRCCAARTDLPE